MDIIQLIENETSIDKLKDLALTHLKILYNKMIVSSARAEMFEFLLGSFDLSVDFDFVENPKVSIVIPVKNEYVMTSVLLQSIKQNTQNIEYEIIIADDNSTDEISDIENHFKNIRRIQNDTGHSGFIYNVNNAISKAKGEYVFLMNNDMLTLPNYLNELLFVIENDNTIGIAGSKTLSIDGSVDECGLKMKKEGVVFLGQLQEENYLDDKKYIECDYCSGCSILFKRSIFLESGMFDTKLAPAYYEDADFAFNLKYNHNLKSVCVPRSKLFHFRSISYNNEIKHDTSKNKEYFLQKWGKYIII